MPSFSASEQQHLLPFGERADGQGKDNRIFIILHDDLNGDEDASVIGENDTELIILRAQRVERHLQA